MKYFTLSVIIPAYNEEKRIKNTLEDVQRWIKERKIDAEVIIVNDGSLDNTLKVLKEFEEKSIFKVISYEKNMGKGYAVKEGMLNARGKIRLFMDADNSTTIDHFDLMLPFFEKGYDVVIGSRHKKDAKGAMQVKKQFFVKRFIGKAGNLLVRTLLDIPFYDTQCGFKAFTDKSAIMLFGNLKTYGWAFDMEILYMAMKMNFKIGVIPVKWYNKEGSKVKFFDYLKTLSDVLRIRFGLHLREKIQ